MASFISRIGFAITLRRVQIGSFHARTTLAIGKEEKSAIDIPPPSFNEVSLYIFFSGHKKRDGERD